MKKSNLLFFILISFVMAVNSAFGCLCTIVPDSPKEAKRWSEAVFSGEIVAFEEEGINGLYTFKVERVWKGVTEKQIVLADLMYKSSCDNGLKLGQRYMIFASYTYYDPLRIPEKKYLSLDKEGKPRPVIDTCSWSTNLSNTEKSKKILKKIGKGRLMK